MKGERGAELDVKKVGKRDIGLQMAEEGKVFALLPCVYVCACV